MPRKSFFQRRRLQSLALILITFFVVGCASTQSKEVQAIFSATSPTSMTVGPGTLCVLNEEPTEAEAATLLKILPLLSAKDIKQGDEEKCDVWVAVSFVAQGMDGIMTLDTHRNGSVSTVSVKADRASWEHDKVLLSELVDSYGLNLSWELKCIVDGRARCSRYIDEAGSSIAVPRAGVLRMVRPYYTPPGTGGPGQEVPEPIRPPRRY